MKRLVTNLNKKSSLLAIIIISSLLFFIAVIFDVTPYLRGPEPYAPEWQWAYFFVNTLDKLYAPLLFIALLLLLFIFSEKKKYC